MPMAIPAKRMTSVASQAARSGRAGPEQAHERIERPRVKSAISGVRLKECIGSQNGSSPCRGGEPTRSVEREVVLQVVARDEEASLR